MKKNKKLSNNKNQMKSNETLSNKNNPKNIKFFKNLVENSSCVKNLIVFKSIYNEFIHKTNKI